MPQPFNAIKQFFTIDGATIRVTTATGEPYAAITINPDFTITVAKATTAVMEKLDELISTGVAGLFKYVSRTHAAKPALTPADLVQGYWHGMSTSQNRQNFPKRGDRSR